jgi:RimJ/RimL family protein N-acetyltransferase
MPLMGERVMLRALEERDLDLIWEAYKDFDLELTTSGDSPPVSDHQVKAFWLERIDRPAADMRYFAIEPLPGQKGAGQFAGMCNLQGIDYRNRLAEVAVWLASPDLRGLGYGTNAVRALLPYAFDVARLDKLYLGVYDFNEGGLRCYERLGFRYEGHLRQQIHYQGRYWDEWAMRILRSEWELICQPPAEGLRPYHPADQDGAIRLIQQVLSLPDGEAARAKLRGWWRQIEHEVYSYQVEGVVIGLAVIAPDQRCYGNGAGGRGCAKGLRV